MPEVITNHLDLWTAALLTKSTAGRGSNGKQEAYGVKKLRELILELAVRGRLVPQDPNDEPASELLKKVAAEKARMVNEGIIKKEKDFPTIADDEIPFDVPNRWEWARIDDVGHDWGQKTPDADFTYIDVSAIDNSSGVVSSPSVLSASGAPSRARKIVTRGTVIYSTVRPYLKNICVIEEDYSPEPIASTAFAILHPFQNMPGKFFALYFRSPEFVKYVELVQTGIAYPAINDKQFYGGLIPVPPLAEQHRIVAKVDELMALCDQLEKHQAHSIDAHQTLVETLLGTLTLVELQQELSETWTRVANHFDILFTTEHSIDQLKQTVLQLAVMGKLVPQDPNDEPASELLKKVAAEKARMVEERKIKKEKDFPTIADDEIPFDVPDGWEWARIDDVGHDWGQKTPDADFTYIDVSAIDNSSGVISSPSVLSASGAPSRARKIVTRGTVIYSTVRPYLKNICVIEEDYSPELIASTAFAILHPFQNMPGKFFALYFRSPEFVKYVELVQTGIAYPAINDKQFYGGLVPVPPLAEQHRIVTKVDELMALCDVLKVRLGEAQTTQLHLADAIVEQAVA